MLKATARALAGKRFEPIDPDALLRLGPLGLRATGQRLADGGELVVEARPVIAPVDERLFCASCGAMGRRKGTDARVLAHAPTTGRVTRLLVRVPRIACQLCRRTWRVDISSVAGPRSILTRSAAAWALEAVALDNMAVSRAGRGAPGGLVGRRQRRRPESRHKGPGAPGGAPAGRRCDRGG